MHEGSTLFVVSVFVLLAVESLFVVSVFVLLAVVSVFESLFVVSVLSAVVSLLTKQWEHPLWVWQVSQLYWHTYLYQSEIHYPVFFTSSQKESEL